jgi:hypothetical protein
MGYTKITLTDTSLTSWTPPDIYGDVRSYPGIVVCRGAGGGGVGWMGFNHSGDDCMGSGAGEAVVTGVDTVLTFTPGVSHPLSIGTQGQGGAAAYDDDALGACGLNGGDTLFGEEESPICLAHGGEGGSPGAYSYSTASPPPGNRGLGFGGGCEGSIGNGHVPVGYSSAKTQVGIGDRKAPGGSLCGGCDGGCGAGQGGGFVTVNGDPWTPVQGAGDQEWGGSKDSPLLDPTYGATYGVSPGVNPNQDIDAGDGGLGTGGASEWVIRPAAAGVNPPSTVHKNGFDFGGGGAGDNDGPGGIGGRAAIILYIPNVSSSAVSSVLAGSQ